MSYALVRRTPYAGTLQTHSVRLSNPTTITNKFGWKPNFSGTGVLSGIAIDTPNAPNPTPVEVRVLIRHENPDLDGLLIYKTSTTVGAAFSFANVDPNLRYDIVGRMEGRRDQIVSNVKPFNEPRFSPMQIPVGIPVDEPLPIIGGTGSVSAAYVSGSFPSGVSLVGDRLQGTWPTGATGSYTVIFDLTDDEGTYTKVLTIDLYLLPMKLAGSIPMLMIVGDPISTTFTASGGEGPYTYSVSAGSLPAGLSLNGSTGELSGTPSVSGAYSFSITATDVRSASASKTYSGAVFEDTPYRWWRVYITEANSEGYGSICELEFLDGNGVRYSLAGGTPVASSEFNASHSAAYAFDGLVNNDAGGNVWAPSNSTPPSWLGYQHANAVDVRAIRITARRTENATQSPKTFAIQCSDDGSTWTTVWSESGQTGWTGYEQRTFPRP